MTQVTFWRGVMSILFLGLTLIFLFHVWGVLLPFFFGFVLAYLMHPLVEWFVGLGLRRDRIVGVLYVLLLVAGGILGSQLIPALYHQINEALANLPSYTQAVSDGMESMNTQIQATLSRFIGEKAYGFTLPFQVESLAEQLFYKLPANLMNVAHIAMWLFIVPFVSFFTLCEEKKWVRHLFNWTPSAYVENLLGLLAQVNATLGGYVRGLVMESFLVGGLTFLGLWALGLKGALLISVITGLVNVIPLMALAIGGSIAIIAAYVQAQSVSVLLGILLVYLVVRLVDDIFIIPFVMRQNVQLHPILTLFAILAGVELGGFIGLIFAIPVAAVIKVVLLLFLEGRRDSLVTSQHVYS